MSTAFRVARAARIVVAGGVIAYPTEAVFGLGCLPLDREAVRRILALKRRPASMGLLLIASDVAQLAPFAALLDSPQIEAIRASWPGPHTWIVQATPRAPVWITGGRDSVGVRVTAHPLARALCERAGSALVSTSANVTGHPPLRRALAVRRAFGERIDFVLAGATGDEARPTRIRDGRSGATIRS